MNTMLRRRAMIAAGGGVPPTPPPPPVTDGRAVWPTTDNTAYFATDIKPQVGYKVEAKMKVTSTAGSSGRGNLFGVRTAGGDGGSWNLKYADNSYNSRPNWLAVGTKFTPNPYPGRLSVDTDYVFICDDLGFSINGTRYNYADESTATFTATYPDAGIGIGRLLRGDGAVVGSYSMNGELYYIKIWDSQNNLIHHLVPQPIPGNTGYAQLYDNVTETVYSPSESNVIAYSES